MSNLDFRHILDLTQDAVVVGDRAGRIVHANAAAHALLRWPPGELVGKPLTAIIPPALRGRHTAGFNRYRSTRSPRILGRSIRAPALRRDGAEIRVELTLEEHRGGAGAEWYVASLRELSPGAERERRETAAPSVEGLLRALGLLTPELDEAHLSSRLNDLFSAHLGVTASRLYVAGENVVMRLGEGVRPVPELGEPVAGVPSGDSAHPVLRAAFSRQPSVSTRMDLLPFDQQWLAEQRISGVGAFPLLFGGNLEGVLLCCAGEPLAAEQQALLALGAGQLAAVLRERRQRELIAAGERARERAAALAHLARRLGAGENPAAFMHQVLERGLALLPADEGCVALDDAPGEGYVVQACAGYGAPLTGLRIPAGVGLASQAAASGETVVTENYPALPHPVPRIKQRGARVMLAAPVRSREGRVIGALKLGRKQQGHPFRRDEQELAEALAALVGLCLSLEH